MDLFSSLCGKIEQLSAVQNAHPDKAIFLLSNGRRTRKFCRGLQWHVRNLIIGPPGNGAEMCWNEPCFRCKLPPSYGWRMYKLSWGFNCFVIRLIQGCGLLTIAHASSCQTWFNQNRFTNLTDLPMLHLNSGRKKVLLF